MALVLDLCGHLIWILAGLQHPHYICIGVHELYVYRATKTSYVLKHISKKNHPACLSFAAPHKHQVNIDAMKKKTESKNHKVGTGNASTGQVVLPFQPLSLVFDHINYFVDMPKVSS